MASDEKKQETNIEKEQNVLEKPNYIGKTNDIFQELERLKKEFENNYKPLIARKVINIPTKENNAENKNNNDNINNNKVNVKIMQFNILADGLSSVYEPTNKMFKDHIRECLNFHYRGFRLIEEIIQYKPDIITFQEVDQINFLNHYLSPFGYKYIHITKPKSPVVYVAKGCNKDLLPDGCAIFWNSNIWKQIKTYPLSTVTDKTAPKNIRNLTVAVAHLQHIKNNNKEIIVASTHLKAHFSMDSDIKRIKQLLYMMPKLKQLSQDKIPVFIGADFNSVPMNMINPWQGNSFFPFAYQSVVNGKYLLDRLNNDMKDNNDLNDGQKCIKQYDFKTKNNDAAKQVMELLNVKENKYEYGYGLGLKNAYCYGEYKGKKYGSNPGFTCTLGGLHCLDYILFQPNKDVQVVKLLETLEKKGNHKLVTPSWEYPSDHFSLMAVFTL